MLVDAARQEGVGSNYLVEHSAGSGKSNTCKGDEAPLKGDALDRLRDELGDDWNVADEHHLEKTYTFDDFRQALDFTNRVGEVAEDQGHHPDIYLTYGKVKLQIWTHKIGGLTESDFIFAAKADEAR